MNECRSVDTIRCRVVLPLGAREEEEEEGASYSKQTLKQRERGGVSARPARRSRGSRRRIGAVAAAGRNLLSERDAGLDVKQSLPTHVFIDTGKTESNIQATYKCPNASPFSDHPAFHIAGPSPPRPLSATSSFVAFFAHVCVDAPHSPTRSACIRGRSRSEDGGGGAERVHAHTTLYAGYKR